MDWIDRNELAAQAFESARRSSGSPYVRANCPFCLAAVGKEDKKQCLSFHAASGWYHCFRCDTRGRLDMPDRDESIFNRPPPPKDAHKVDPPEGFMQLSKEPAYSAESANAARTYLRGRGLVDEKVWDAARIGVCLSGKYFGRVVVPILSPEAIWWGWVARVWVKKAERPYLNAPGMALGIVGGLFNQVALSEKTDDPIMVMEGVFDALSYWPDAVAVLGKPTEAQISTLLGSKRPVAIVLDGDAWEQAEMLSLRLRFDGQRAGFVRLPPRTDPDEIDPGWLREEVKQCLQ